MMAMNSFDCLIYKSFYRDYHFYPSNRRYHYILLISPGDLDGKESACSAGDMRDVGSIPGSERSPGEGNSNPLWYSCLENPMDREVPGGLYPIGSQRVGHD